jgi:hypothetical protein
MKDQKGTVSSSEDLRKARLAEALRANLMKRKAQTRARRAGEADQRPQGIGTAETKPKADP